MLSINYPNIEEHRIDHSKFLNFFYNTTNYFEPVTTILKETDVMAICTKLVSHLEVHDVKYTKFINNIS